MNAALISIAAFFLSVFFTGTLRTPASRVALVDRPGGRKKHVGEVPVIGGLCIALAFGFSVITVPYHIRPYGPLFAGMALLLVCGVVDDIKDLRSSTKLVCQLLAALFMASWGNVIVDSLGALEYIGDVELGSWAIPFTVLVVVGLVNAINMMDGVDGLAGGISLSSLVWIGVAAHMAKLVVPAHLISVLCACVFGFLLYNMRHPWRKQASVFLGDAGSMFLGFAIAWFAVEVSQDPANAYSPVMMGWILALPVLDTVSLMIRRLNKGQSPFAADREHLHHIFQRAGYSPAATTYILVGISFALGGVGVLGAWYGVPDSVLLCGLIAVALLHYYFITRAWRTMKALKRLRRFRKSVKEGGSE